MKEKQNIFRFKRFEIRNEISAMKVGTDGVLLGAWADTEGVRNVLDIGTGTGLIALMIAQRNEYCDITGVEIEPGAAREAVANVKESPWADRIDILHGDITKLDFEEKRFDLIISNPPFFNNGILPQGKERSAARHESGLTVKFLIDFASAHLSETGHLSFIAPADRSDDIEFLAAMGRLVVERRFDVVTKPGKMPKRVLWQLAKHPSVIINGSIAIHDDTGNYSAAYKSLTSEFYL